MRRPLAPLLTLVAVTALLVPYGSHSWSWLAGPLVGLGVWSLDRVARKRRGPAPARARVQRTAVLPTTPDRD